MANGPVSIRDVARRAGVSVGTASLALNNRPYVSEQARQRVLSAVSELGYVPNLIGKALNRRKCGVIGVLVPVAVPPHFPTIVVGISEGCEADGKTLFASYSHDSAAIEDRLLKMFRHLHVDGIILAAAPSRENAGLVSSLMREGTPVVQVERYLPNVVGDFVGSDNRATICACVRRLIAAGRREIGLAHASTDYSVNDERYQGYLDALAEAGIEPRPEWVLTIDITRKDQIVPAIDRYLRDPRTPPAIIWNMGCVEPMARLLSEMGKVNGADVDIVLVDADPMRDLSGQTFANLMQDGRRIGTEAARILRARIEEYGNGDGNGDGNGSRKGKEPTHLRLPCIETHLVQLVPQAALSA